MNKKELEKRIDKLEDLLFYLQIKTNKFIASDHRYEKELLDRGFDEEKLNDVIYNIRYTPVKLEFKIGINYVLDFKLDDILLIDIVYIIQEKIKYLRSRYEY